MAGSLNKVQLIGRLGKDPEAHNFEDGGKVVNFTLATSETWKDRETGEPRERTQWHQIAIFNEALAEITLRYLKKGSLVYLEGQLETRKWRGNDGADRTMTEVVLRPYRGEITMLDPAPRAARPARQAHTAAAPAGPR
jgi:single-strand DNA-binding protein